MTLASHQAIADELAAVRAELPRVDAKVGTLASLTMAGLAFLATQVAHGPILVRILMSAAGVLLAAATLVLLLAVLRPRFGTTGGFRRWARLSEEEIPAALGEDSRHVRDLITIASIADRKFTGLRWAVDLTAIAVALTAVALVVRLLA